MITVTICKNHDGDITEFETRGHAGYDDSGKDIVCEIGRASCRERV